MSATVRSSAVARYTKPSHTAIAIGGNIKPEVTAVAESTPLVQRSIDPQNAIIVALLISHSAGLSPSLNRSFARDAYHASALTTDNLAEFN